MTRKPPAPDARLRVLYVRLGRDDAPDGTGPGTEDRYARLLALLADVSPVVQPLPPDAALVDVGGALRYFGRDAVALAGLVRLRTTALYGGGCTIGVAANPLLARMAARAARPGTVRVVRPGEEAEFLDRRPVIDLHGVGPATARTLCGYGLDTVGRVAAAPPATLQRILGASAGRRVYAYARGIDPSPVAAHPRAGAGTTAQPGPMTAEHRFGHDELDPSERRRALLALADDLGYRLRSDELAARGLTLTVRYADRSVTTRTRTLPEPTAHTPALASAAYALHDALGLQRARVRGLALRVEDPAEGRSAPRQLSLDPREEKARRAEAAADRARRRFGVGAVQPAGAHGRPRAA
ncbi:hypothetical protein [Streptomyces sp. HNM0574]|uniref:DNA polymerase Y family protein n=1 Tax=Streptomyces sp. HNM0574 TaxID=2714954 RepID=UPI00146AFBF6|nr:hypothetical protein [Streptomyces sp. HNM0574]NLU69048.1 hypothetical protein [Streptomyces sp. HNM0574]